MFYVYLARSGCKSASPPANGTLVQFRANVACGGGHWFTFMMCAAECREVDRVDNTLLTFVIVAVETVVLKEAGIHPEKSRGFLASTTKMELEGAVGFQPTEP